MTGDTGAGSWARKDSNAWGTDRDLWGLDLWMAGHEPPVAEGPITWSTEHGEQHGTEIRDRDQLAALLSALASGAAGMASREAVRLRALNVAAQGEGPLMILEFPGDSPGQPALRIFRGLRDTHYLEAPIDDRGYRDVELVDAAAAARIMWSALETGLPVGYYSIPVADGPGT